MTDFMRLIITSIVFLVLAVVVSYTTTNNKSCDCNCKCETKEEKIELKPPVIVMGEPSVN